MGCGRMLGSGSEMHFDGGGIDLLVMAALSCAWASSHPPDCLRPDISGARKARMGIGD